MSKEIEKVLSLYEEILSNKRSLINEADIAGVDELVYNPVTGPNGDLGYGYDNGKKVQGIRWDGHDNHLHLGFTNRDVAMKVIDYADSMGLGTSENPYAKKDPNGKVDPVHTENSLHYKTFDGTPAVGAAVDITGNKDKILEFIKWVESNFANGGVTYAQTPTKTSKDTLSQQNMKTNQTGSNIKDSDFYKGISFTEQNQNNKKLINEQSIFGKKVSNRFGKIIIPKSNNSAIISAIDGVVVSPSFKSRCSNQTLIRNNNNGTIYFQYCGITNPKVRPGNNVTTGQVIGTSDNDVIVTQFDENFDQIRIPETFNGISSNKDKKRNPKSTDIYSGRTFSDPGLAAIIALPYLAARKLKNSLSGNDDKEDSDKSETPEDKKKDDSWLKKLLRKKSGGTITPDEEEALAGEIGTGEEAAAAAADAILPELGLLAFESKSDRNQRRIQENITRIKKLL